MKVGSGKLYGTINKKIKNLSVRLDPLSELKTLVSKPKNQNVVFSKLLPSHALSKSDFFKYGRFLRFQIGPWSYDCENANMICNVPIDHFKNYT